MAIEQKTIDLINADIDGELGDPLFAIRASRSVTGKCACKTPTGSARPRVRKRTAVRTS